MGGRRGREAMELAYTRKCWFLGANGQLCMHIGRANNIGPSDGNEGLRDLPTPPWNTTGGNLCCYEGAPAESLTGPGWWRKELACDGGAPGALFLFRGPWLDGDHDSKLHLLPMTQGV
jgi:hypothetical protein